MKRSFFVGALVIFTSFAIACGGGGAISDAIGTGKEAKKAKEREPSLSMKKYNAVSNGMSYSEVCSVIGSSGEEMSSNNLGGLQTVMYMWKGDFGANMNATFQNDKLVSKAQFGLK